MSRDGTLRDYKCHPVVGVRGTGWEGAAVALSPEYYSFQVGIHNVYINGRNPAYTIDTYLFTCTLFVFEKDPRPRPAGARPPPLNSSR
jgi:hypothetical protein